MINGFKAVNDETRMVINYKNEHKFVGRFNRSIISKYFQKNVFGVEVGFKYFTSKQGYRKNGILIVSHY